MPTLRADVPHRDRVAARVPDLARGHGDAAVRLGQRVRSHEARGRGRRGTRRLPGLPRVRDRAPRDPSRASSRSPAIAASRCRWCAALPSADGYPRPPHRVSTGYPHPNGRCFPQWGKRVEGSHRCDSRSRLADLGGPQEADADHGEPHEQDHGARLVVREREHRRPDVVQDDHDHAEAHEAEHEPARTTGDWAWASAPSARVPAGSGASGRRCCATGTSAWLRCYPGSRRNVATAAASTAGRVNGIG